MTPEEEQVFKRAEELLADGQHGQCDDQWKRRVRDYFSSYERGVVIYAMRNPAEEDRE